MDDMMGLGRQDGGDASAESDETAAGRPSASPPPADAIWSLSSLLPPACRLSACGVRKPSSLRGLEPAPLSASRAS